MKIGGTNVLSLECRYKFRKFVYTFMKTDRASFGRSHYLQVTYYGLNTTTVMLWKVPQ